ncbi:MAG: hypothetical protein GY758_03425 [Fuerstiella sp.]|nr:hypothetical protein [Fuerstiella sp.]MCP4787115.1 hypothetical protein [Fuerstiella sp.]MCP4859145.1 hypothetical protein [Fuerstiella sp.]
MLRPHPNAARWQPKVADNSYAQAAADSDGQETARPAAHSDHLQGQKYNGESAPRLVLFSPIANEDLEDPILPDGSENNVPWQLYTAAMEEVAKERSVPFVNLFAATNRLYKRQRDKAAIQRSTCWNTFSIRRRRSTGSFSLSSTV